MADPLAQHNEFLTSCSSLKNVVWVCVMPLHVHQTFTLWVICVAAFSPDIPGLAWLGHCKGLKVGILLSPVSALLRRY